MPGRRSPQRYRWPQRGTYAA